MQVRLNVRLKKLQHNVQRKEYITEPEKVENVDELVRIRWRIAR